MGNEIPKISINTMLDSVNEFTISGKKVKTQLIGEAKEKLKKLLRYFDYDKNNELNTEEQRDAYEIIGKYVEDGNLTDNEVEKAALEQTLIDKSENPETKREALVKLYKMGVSGDIIKKYFYNMINDVKEEMYKYENTKIAGFLVDLSPVSFSYLKDALKSNDVTESFNAFMALRLMGLKAKELIPFLVDALKDLNPDKRGFRTDILKYFWGIADELGPVDKNTLDAIVNVMKTDREADDTAAFLLSKLDPKTVDLWKPLIEILKDPHYVDYSINFKLNVIKKLQDMGQNAVPALNELKNIKFHGYLKEKVNKLIESLEGK